MRPGQRDPQGHGQQRQEQGRAEGYDQDALARAFEAYRPRLLRVAYSTTGSLTEAEDCVQESWLRLRRVPDPAAIHDLGAWLTRTVGRLALDALGSARARREQYVGTWLPEPLVEQPGTRGDLDPVEQITLDESVSMALLVVLEQLSPAERTAFLLHDIFGLSFPEVAEVVGRSPAAVRQLASRARRHVEDGQPRFPPSDGQQRELVAAFVTACRQGELDRLVTLLDPEVVCRGDGGGKVGALGYIERGALNVAKVLLAFSRQLPETPLMAVINGAPGLVIRGKDGRLSTVALTFDNGRITAVDVMRNPDKLGTLLDIESATRD
ncbi:RNA polymerase sigma factor SigJ [Streptomyces sp. N2-109]|uniref:RNA polymerase sigma factor SigJ n=1 Tax=Streptomyces gossypii TaxID=2883101 RepID=A0ABT2JXN6_9ACTN|nr:RNA polymerase sigma factor SigJ [Streptomyces gossypii]MCT2592664.1 RNA polymerase sigma factor SigJ [Streptomyces gossypii]